jgi:hypothetical protein
MCPSTIVQGKQNQYTISLDTTSMVIDIIKCETCDNRFKCWTSDFTTFSVSHAHILRDIQSCVITIDIKPFDCVTELNLLGSEVKVSSSTLSYSGVITNVLTDQDNITITAERGKYV